ncbi:hypothetical protein [Pseudonocardia spinosispora]|uniref:hypothetical protein n=1 Tax=Pseudonocardia spinosispora TaxID=103441 RepID=UPI0003F55807|nr:hypothetical protein [Pseudonocardia spinosispora]
MGGIHSKIDVGRSRRRRIDKPASRASAGRMSAGTTVLDRDPEPRPEPDERPTPRGDTRPPVRQTAEPDAAHPTTTPKKPKPAKRPGRTRALLLEIALFTLALAGAGMIGMHRTRLIGLALVVASLTAVYLLRRRRSGSRWGTATAFAALTFAVIGGLVVTMAPDGPLRSVKPRDVGSWVRSAVIQGITMKPPPGRTTMPVRAPMTPDPEREPAVPAFSAPTPASPTLPPPPIPAIPPVPSTPPLPSPQPPPVPPPAPIPADPPSPLPFNEPPPESREKPSPGPSPEKPSPGPSPKPDHIDDAPADDAPSSDHSDDRSDDSKPKSDHHVKDSDRNSKDEDDHRSKKSDDDDSDFGDLARSMRSGSGDEMGGGFGDRPGVNSGNTGGGMHSSGSGFGGPGGSANGSSGADSGGPSGGGNGGNGGQGGNGGNGFG